MAADRARGSGFAGGGLGAARVAIVLGLAAALTAGCSGGHTASTPALGGAAAPGATPPSAPPPAPPATTPPPQPPASVPPAPPPPGTFAGSHALIARDVPIGTTTGARFADAAFDPRSGLFAVSYGVATNVYRSEVRAVDITGGAIAASGATAAEDLGFPAPANTALPAVAAASGQGPSRVLVAFGDDRLGNGNGRQEIFAQLLELAPSGAPPLRVGANIDVSQVPATEEVQPSAVFDPASGRFLVSWSDDREVPARGWEGRAAYARTVALDGSVGPEIKLGDSVPWQIGTTGAAGGGLVLVAWSDVLVQNGANSSGCRARLIDTASPAPVGPIVELLRTGDMPLDPPAVAFDDREGRFLVVWAETATSGADRRVFGALVSPQGQVLRARFPVASSAVGATAPRLAYGHGTASYLLTYHAMQTNEAFALELDPNGDPAGSPYLLSAATPWLGTFYHAVAASPAGSFFVATSENWSSIEGALFEAPRTLP